MLTEVCHLVPEKAGAALLRWVAAGGASVFHVPDEQSALLAGLMDQYNPVTVVPTVPYFAPTINDPTPRFESYTGQKNVLPNPTITAAQRATVVIRLPADARLFVDQQLLELTSAERTFVTPELPLGREYAYSFKIEYDRNGRTLSESQKVHVTAGKASTVVFEDLTVAAKAKATETAVTAKLLEPTKPVSAEKPKTAEELANPFRGNNGYVSTPMPA